MFALLDLLPEAVIQTKPKSPLVAPVLGTLVNKSGSDAAAIGKRVVERVYHVQRHIRFFS
jgi:hypothetical protein